MYLVDVEYTGKDEFGIRWNDPALGLPKSWYRRAGSIGIKARCDCAVAQGCGGEALDFIEPCVRDFPFSPVARDTFSSLPRKWRPSSRRTAVQSQDLPSQIFPMENVRIFTVDVPKPHICGHRYIDLDISPMTDSDLLRKYVDDGDEDAFAQIVDRHIDMVYAAANRQLGRSSHAEDVTQAVFIVLAKKAVKVDGNTLAGWLVKAARLMAMQAIREEWRRKQREQQAAVMKAESYRPQDWERVGPIVDEALSRLGQKDRTAVTLRYLEGREIGEVAASLGVSEAAAAKRLTALE